MLALPSGLHCEKERDLMMTPHFEIKHYSIFKADNVSKRDWISEALRQTKRRLVMQPSIRKWELNTVLFPSNELTVWYRNILRAAEQGKLDRDTNPTPEDYQELIVEGPPIKAITFRRIGDNGQALELDRIEHATKLKVGVTYKKNDRNEWIVTVCHFGKI